VVPIFFNRRPDAAPGCPHITNDLRSRATPFFDVLHLRCGMRVNDPKLAHLGISRKDLRTDTETGERSFLLMLLPPSEPPRSRRPTEMHPTVDATYAISCPLVGWHGEMSPGAYFSRPPGVAQSSFSTR